MNLIQIKEKINRLEEQHANFERDTTYINLLNELALEYQFIIPDSSLFFSQRAFDLSNQINYNEGKIESSIITGEFYLDQGDTKKAIEYHERAVQISQNVNLPKFEVEALYYLNISHQYSGNYARALELSAEIIEKAEALHFHRLISYTYGALAILYTEQKDYKQGLAFYKEVRRYNDLIGDELHSAQSLANFGDFYNQIGEHRKALKTVNESIEILEKYQDYEWLKFAYTVKGESYMGQKKYKWALYWFDQAKFIFNKLNDERDLINLYYCYSLTYFNLGNIELAEEYSMKSYGLARDISELYRQQKSAEVLYKVYKKKNDPINALKYHEFYVNALDSLSRDENKKGIAFFKANADYKSQRKALIAKNKAALAKQRNYIYIGIFVLVALLSTAIPLYLNQKKLVRLYQQLKLKSKALKERESQLEKIDRTKNQLFSIIGHDLRGPIGGLQSLLNLFSNNEIPKSEFDNFVIKLKSDVDNILFSLNNLLSWGQTLLNNNITKPGVVKLKDRTQESVKLLNENAKSKGITVINKIDEKAFIWVDENELDVIIRNLLNNAIKFTPESGFIILDAAEEESNWVISVKDNGVGMTKDISDRIFSNEEMITTFGTNNEKGNGLGLSLCQEMVMNNKGKIWVESEPKKGSTFFFAIPKVLKSRFKLVG